MEDRLVEVAFVLVSSLGHLRNFKSFSTLSRNPGTVYFSDISAS